MACNILKTIIKGFAAIVHPLNDLLVGNFNKNPHKKKTPFKWEASQQKVFDTVTEKPSNPSVFSYADYRLPFKLHTDASCIGLEAVLYKHQYGFDCVIGYASCSLKQLSCSQAGVSRA